MADNTRTGARDQLHLAGLPIDNVDQATVVERVVGGVRKEVGGWVATPNIDHLRIISEQPEVRELLDQVDLTVADGMPLIWASRLLERPLLERVPGSDLIFTVTTEAAAHDVGVFLLGGQDGVACEAASRLAAINPGLRVGWHYPPHGFEEDRADMAAIVDAVRAFGPAVVFVGLGFPKQERLIAVLRTEAPVSWFIGAGAALDFAAGTRSRAPMWMQRTGLEWIHRLASEPGRLLHRYLVDVPFAARLLARSWVEGRRSRKAASSPG